MLRSVIAEKGILSGQIWEGIVSGGLSWIRIKLDHFCFSLQLKTLHFHNNYPITTIDCWYSTQPTVNCLHRLFSSVFRLSTALCNCN